MNLENTKVYTTDTRIIQKYARLIGKEFTEQLSKSRIGVFHESGNKKIYDFAENSAIDASEEMLIVSEQQVSLMYAQRFNPESLGVIDTTSKQVDSLAKGDVVEWADKDELPPIGCKVMTSFTESDCDNWCDFHGPSEIIAYHNDYVWVAHYGGFNRIHALSDIEFEKPESQEQKAERERLEAAIELHDIANLSYYDGCLPFNCGWDSAGDKIKDMWLAIVDKTGYRKQ